MDLNHILISGEKKMIDIMTYDVSGAARLQNGVNYASRFERKLTYSSLREMTGQNQPQFPETVIYYS